MKFYGVVAKFVSIAFCVSVGHAETVTKATPLLNDVQFETVPTFSNSHFVYPNEIRPERFLGTIDGEVPNGLLVSVGFERSFIGAAMLPNITGLVVLDFHSQIISNTDINTSMLQAFADKPESYLKFRTKGTADTLAIVEAFLPKSKWLDAWNFISLSKVLWEGHFNPKGERAFIPEINYWTDPRLRNKLIQMAVDQRIAARQVDLFDVGGRLKTVIENLRQHGEKIAVLDLSNALEWIYDGLDRREGSYAVRSILHTISPALHPDAKLLFTTGFMAPRANNRFDTFEYHSYTIRDLMKLSDEQLEKQLHPMTFRLGEGRTATSYFKEKMPPTCQALFSRLL